MAPMAEANPATPPIVHYFISELLRHSERLAVEAMAMNTGSDLTVVSFFCEGWVLTAHYDLEAAEFVVGGHAQLRAAAGRAGGVRR